MAKTRKKDSMVSQVQAWKARSAQLRMQYDTRWAKNLKLTRGIFTEETASTASRVRNKRKMFFRKIWATIWRLIASFYTVFLKDDGVYEIQGRGADDHDRAGVLQNVVKFRIDEMNRTDRLFLKHIWAFQNISYMGLCVGELTWEFDDELGIDGPKYIVYPNEQVYPDLTADIPQDMAYIIFENYMTKEQMEAAGYENIDKCEPKYIPNNQVRSVRFNHRTDPLQNPGEKEYPKPGTYDDDATNTDFGSVYLVHRAYYKKDGKIMFCAVCDEHMVKAPIESPYGNRYPVVMGVCLTEPHMMIAEGFPEPMEGPQESYNFNMNMRKDNVALTMNRQTFVSRFGNVDLQSLTNKRPGGVTMMDDVNAVKVEDYPDVTRTSYQEAASDDAMMQELSGVTAQIQGLSNADTATEAQINMGQGAAKIELYTAIVAETYYREFISLLAYLISRFETDETIIKIANERYRQTSGYKGDDIYDFDFYADIIINVGMLSGREAQLRNWMVAMDRAIMSNQSAVQLLTSGAQVPNGVKMVDIPAMFAEVMPLLGKRNVDKFVFMAAPPANPAQGFAKKVVGDRGAMTGTIQPQVGDMGGMPPQNQAQAGGLGGVY